MNVYTFLSANGKNYSLGVWQKKFVADKKKREREDSPPPITGGGF
ncbi:MAG: hypothetical protein OEW58_01545 [Gammaproteobacteria bacterium]|nr:hypothetical protein [Gammaproteobacteria bacterium]